LQDAANRVGDRAADGESSRTQVCVAELATITSKECPMLLETLSLR
jgi:hypothetical protein